MKVEFLPDAEQELIEAAFDYEDRVPGLGTRFATEVSRVIDILVDHQLIGPKLDSIHRRIALQRFPFALIYRLDEGVIRIVAIAHHRRRPRYWRPRVQER